MAYHPLVIVREIAQVIKNTAANPVQSMKWRWGSWHPILLYFPPSFICLVSVPPCSLSPSVVPSLLSPIPFLLTLFHPDLHCLLYPFQVNLLSRPTCSHPVPSFPSKANQTKYKSSSVHITSVFIVRLSLCCSYSVFCICSNNFDNRIEYCSWYE